MAEDIKRTENMLGDFEIRPTKREIKNRNLFHRCLVTTKNILKGEKFTLDNISLKRVNNRSNSKIEPKNLSKILAKKSNRNISKDTQLLKQFINWKN